MVHSPCLPARALCRYAESGSDPCIPTTLTDEGNCNSSSCHFIHRPWSPQHGSCGMFWLAEPVMGVPGGLWCHTCSPSPLLRNGASVPGVCQGWAGWVFSCKTTNPWAASSLTPRERQSRTQLSGARQLVWAAPCSGVGGEG